MKSIEVPIPEIGLFAATRAMLGAGAGLLIATRLGDRKRKMLGRTLFAIGALSTIPLAMDIHSRRKK